MTTAAVNGSPASKAADDPKPPPPYQVKLLTDLTRYHPSLVAGTIGTLLPRRSAMGDNFAVVEFPEARSWDILHKSYDILDPAYIAWAEREEERWQAKVAAATAGEHKTGPRGGWRSMSFAHPDGVETVYNRDRGEATLKQLQERGIEIKTVVEP